MALLILPLSLQSIARSEPARRADATASGSWTPITDGLLQTLSTQGKKIGYPGGTAGVTVDRTTGDVFVVVPDQGIWKSSDKGATFARADDGNIGGRCETGYALNFDPQKRRMACFMLDGTAALMSDGGAMWRKFGQLGRGWDFGAVDWSASNPQTILAIHHESGEELQLSSDGGATWKLLGKNYTAIGVFDASTLVATQGDGILRSDDLGVTWSKVSDITPTGRTVCVFHGAGYWVSNKGLLVSKDKGKTWHIQGGPIEAAWGPFFGKSEREICVVGRVGGVAGIWKTQDSGATWSNVAPFPQFDKERSPDWTPSKQWAAGWFANFGWDPINDVFYTSYMGHAAYRFQAH